MARGTGPRNKRITLRITEEEYEELKREANYNNISNISEYARMKLNSKSQNTNIEILEQVCNLSTALNWTFRKYNIEQEDKEYIDREVNGIWQLLK